MTTKNQSWWSYYQRHLKFLKGGRNFPHVDCYGFVVLAFLRECGIRLDNWAELNLDNFSDQKRSLLEFPYNMDFNPVETGFEQAFDVAAIRIPMAVNGKATRGWWHCGIVSRPGFIVEMHEAQGLVEKCFRPVPEACADANLRARDVKLFRHRALTEKQP